MPGTLAFRANTAVSDLRARSKPRASGHHVGLPPVTRAVVTLFHLLVNRPILRTELDVIDDIRAGRATYGDVNFFWRTATFAWFLLIPVGLGSALLLGRAIPAILPATVLTLPFSGGCYSFLLWRITPEVESRFSAGRWYALHDLTIVAVAVLAGGLIAGSL